MFTSTYKVGVGKSTYFSYNKVDGSNNELIVGGKYSYNISSNTSIELEPKSILSPPCTPPTSADTGSGSDHTDTSADTVTEGSILINTSSPIV